MPARSTNIFISYGRADSRNLAIRLRDDLQSLGLSVWLDLDEIAGGDTWAENIENAIEYSDVVLALISPASYESHWCRAEQLRAIRKGKRIIPLMSVKGAEIPLPLEHLNYLDFTSEGRYDEMFRDLVSDITSGQAFRKIETISKSHDTASPFKRARQSTRKGYADEKRTAPSFRRYLRNLRGEDWLGARFWWPYFLFYFTDVHDLIDILQQEEVASPFNRGDNLTTRFDKFVSLYFRPRTPDLFHAEGFRPAQGTPPEKYTPMPVYLLFDMEAVICHPDSRFSDGDPVKVKKTYKTPSYFRDLPFEQIYHDSWFMPDEREEIMRYREAQVLVPDTLGLEALQLIWLRSPAEYDTLRELMPPALWQRWYDKITCRSDYHLFNNKRSYVQSATLEKTHIRFHFNECQSERDCAPFIVTVHIQYADGEEIGWQDEAFIPDKDLTITLPREDAYTVQLLLDADLAYKGSYQPEIFVF